MNIPSKDHPELVALRMAARGAVSGRLQEWPILAQAFRRVGIDPRPAMPRHEMVRLAREALEMLT